jgi:hypothetical protein
MNRLSLAFLVACIAATTSSCSSKSIATGGDAAAATDPNMGTASIGPLPVGAGEEETVCILKRLSNTEDIMATHFVADLAPGSHHLIVYKSTATDEDLEPFPCVPFLGLTDQSAVPIMLVNKLHFESSFPPNVGMVLPAGQMLRIEAHYINTTGADIQGLGQIEVHGLPVAQATGYQAADFAFWGTTKIDIPPKSAAETTVKYQQGIANTNVFAISTHQHSLGTEVQVWSTKGAVATPDPSTQLIDEKDWSNPSLKNFDPPIVFDGTNGFSYQCSWQNNTDQTVQFGESALNEMCFVGAYYYPSQGFDLCIDGRCKSRH